ncbi:MAG: nucleotidyltransferase domain-containing protein [Candidatus Paracaedibacteraceae bacterium]|nr:nucleotidyltransferase domain-containing protein [Candidatus Paracaedibacteraceae bacterium]
MKGIRLTDSQAQTIREVFKQCFCETDKLWLFGSRADLSKKSGDIDLYIETALTNTSVITKAKFSFITKLNIRLGDQKIDVVIKCDETELLIYKIAREEGIQLV